MKLSRLISAPVRRSALGLILVAVVLFPGGAASHRGTPCRACSVTGAVSWARPLAGAWVAGSGAQGTVFAHGQAYAAVGGDVAAVSFGLTVDAFDAGTGFPRWAATLSDVPAGSAIISVRAWPDVVTVGVETGSANRAGQLAADQAEREEFVLDAVTGKHLA